MAVVNSRVDELHQRITTLQQKISLSNSQEQIQSLTDQIAAIKKQIREINRKAPKVVPVKDATTVGDRMEAQLRGATSGSKRMSATRVVL